MPGIAGWASRSSIKTPPIVLSQMMESLSRPWYKVDQYTNEPETISLGCSDLGIVDLGTQPCTLPDQSISVCLYGNIYSPTVSSLSILSYLARHYRDNGLAFINELKGEFFLVIIDHNNQKIILANDRYGRRPVYYVSHEDQILFSSEIKAILACGLIVPDIDEEALADFLTFAFIPGERTLIRQVHMLPPAGLLEFDIRSGKISIQQYWELRHHMHPSTEADTVILDHLAESFRIAVDRRLSPSNINWLSLSAGMDSRTIASVVNNSEVRVKAVTSGVHGGYEQKVTADIAATIGLEHLYYEFDELQLMQSESELTNLYREAISLTDGMRGAPTSAMTAFSSRQRRRHGLESVITGHGGEIAKLDEAYNLAIRTKDDLGQLRSNALDWTYNRLKNPNAPRFNKPILYKGGLAKAIEEIPRYHLKSVIDQLDRSLPPEQIVSYLFLNELHRKRASYALAVQRAYVEIHVPFFDDDFLATVVRAPLSIRSNYRVHRHIINQHHPELLNIVLSETRMRPFPSTAERVYRGLPHMLSKRLGFFKRDVPEHYFAANANIDFFRNTLLGSHTLDRGYFNPDEITKLVNRYAQGEHSVNNLLHLLSIVELWHRDFVDTL